MEKTPEYIEFLKSRISPNVKPEVAELMIKYALTPEENESTFQKIRDYVFSGKKPAQNPKMYLVIGQTGGGKSTLTSSILRENPNTVVIDSDAFKAFNPYRQEICDKYPTLYGYLTGIDAYLHRDAIYHKALEEGYNVLMEIAPSTKDRLFNVDFKQLKEYGYTIDAKVMAVSKINSLLSVHERYEGQIEARMDSPKLTDFKRATDSYDAVAPILEDLIEMEDVNLTLLKRGSFDFDESSIYVPAPEFLTDDRQEMINLLHSTRKQDELETLKESDARVEMIKSQMQGREAPEDQFKQFAKVEETISSINK